MHLVQDNSHRALARLLKGSKPVLGCAQEKRGYCQEMLEATSVIPHLSTGPEP